MPCVYDDVPGSWGDQSKGWPAIVDPDGIARRMVIEQKLVPYGSYVTVGAHLRLETQEYVDKVRKAMQPVESNTAATGMGELPHAVKCNASSTNGGSGYDKTGLWEIPLSPGVKRIVDQRFADGWNAALAAQPAPVGDIPFDTVAKVVEALLWLGHSAPESKEEQAARSVSLVNTLCREVLSTKAQPAPVVGGDNSGDWIETLAKEIHSGSERRDTQWAHESVRVQARFVRYAQAADCVVRCKVRRELLAARPGGEGEASVPMFYIQDTRGYVGNCPLWWRPEGKGYTTRIDEAGKYTLEDAQRKRDTDKPWPCEVVDSIARRTIDMQDLHKIAAHPAQAGGES